MTTRRSLLAIAAAMATPALTVRAQTLTPAPLTKQQVGYQDIPSQGKVCAQCVYFIFVPASGSSPASRCKYVAGPINPAGWCEIWAPRG